MPDDGLLEPFRLLVELGQMINSSLDLKEVFQCAAEQIHDPMSHGRTIGCEHLFLGPPLAQKT